MASKRNTASEPAVSSGAAPARGKSRVTRKHKTIATETPEPVNHAASPAESPVTVPTFEEIARLAYSYWEARGYQGGSPEEDWLRAESALRVAAGASA
jgi:hypothetical protein